MDESQLNILFTNGILVDSSVKDVKITDLDDLIKRLKERGITFLGTNELHDLYGTSTYENYGVEVLKDYDGEVSQSKSLDWVEYFNDRFNRLKTILVNKDGAGVVSLANVKKSPSGTDVKTIAMISSVSISPIKKYTVMDIEDNTESYRAIIPNSDQEVLSDQVVIIKGRKYKDSIFVKEVIYPDIQIKSERPAEIDDTYALFMSDVHIGSKLFAHDAMERFIKWLNGEIDEYSSISKQIKFIVISGDLVDGIGVYPDQEKELDIKSLEEQYDAFFRVIERIPKRIKILLSQGNHDATHIAEPQPRLNPKFAASLYQLPNAVFLSNPYMVNLVVNGNKTSLLSYHGFSIPYYADTITKYSKMNPEDIEAIMKIHLKSRHLAPTHGSTQVLPLPRDYLVIDETPDIYATGHIHKTLASKYKGTILINSSCWQYQTAYQKKYGMDPDIAKVPIVNLRDKSFIILDFLGDEVQVYKKGLKS